MNLILHHQLYISEITACERSSEFAIPKDLINPIKGLIKIQNEDNECFKLVNQIQQKLGMSINNLQNNLILKA